MLCLFINKLAQKIDLLYNDMGDVMSYIINVGEGKFPQHKHKEYEIAVYTKGKAIYHTEERDIEVSRGKITIAPPGIEHSTEICDGIERIYIRGEFNQVFHFTSAVAISDNSKGEGLLLAKMIYENRYENPEYVSALVNALAHFLLRSVKMDDEISLVIKEIINQITANFYDSNLNVTELLEKSGYAEDYIRAQFKKITGRTPIEFLTKVRISHACYLIDSYKNTLSLSEIAEKCGYVDYVYFSRRFKQIVGVSPRQYMKE